MLILLAVTSWAGEAFGVWALNPARSTLAGNEKSVTLRIELHTRREVFTLDTLAAGGRASTFSTILYLDERAREFQDSGRSGTQLSRRVDSGLWKSCASARGARKSARTPGRAAGSTHPRNNRATNGRPTL